MDGHELEHMRHVEQTHFWFAARRRALAPWLAAAARDAPPGAVLDLGTGTGGNLELLAGALPARGLIGIDRSPVALAHCARRDSNVRLVQAEVASLPLRDASLAIVTALDLFEHVDDDALAARQIARCLQPGGELIATVPSLLAPFSEHDRALGHRRRYQRGELDRLLAGAGLEVLESRAFNVLLLPLVVAWRALSRSRRCGDDQPRSEVRPLSPFLNRSLGTILALEASLPLRFKRAAGLSWWVRARRPTQVAQRSTVN
jgi:SAM-dependent methyltransferase